MSSSRLPDSIDIPAGLRILLPSLAGQLARSLAAHGPAELARRLAPEMAGQLAPPLRADTARLLAALAEELERSLEAERR